MNHRPGGETRREFLKQSALIGAALAATTTPCPAASPASTRATKLAWYRRTFRWGQTNITELDPERYDVGWWRKHWQRTETQGVIVNAGGIVAYYPSRVPFHRPAQYLGGRDLFGELCRAAHDDGLAVFARMDSNRAHEELYRAHPDWFAVDREGKPYRAGELYVTCVNGPYYEQHIPAILREIASAYHPEGFTDNSWAGLGRNSPCFCTNCREKFRARTGRELPRGKDWSDPVYHKWISWNYGRRIELWEMNNRVTRAAGGPDCIWSGMVSGSMAGQCQTFRPTREICRRAEMIMLDHQARSDAAGFQHNGEAGKLLHELLGWDKLIPESMAMYQAGKPTFRLASKPAPEARLWMLDGIAGGLQPWWHHVGAYHEDRRMYRTAQPVYHWHKANEKFLVNRQPVATVGLVWSEGNIDFFGRDDPDLLVEQPWRGMAQALIRARIAWLPVHAEDLEQATRQFSALILPNFAAVSDSQVAAIRRFVQNGGGLLATGISTLLDPWGNMRPDFALGDLFGAHLAQPKPALDQSRLKKIAGETVHSYLRLSPERRARVDGPKTGAEPAPVGERHEVLRGFEATDLIPFGGVLDPIQLEPTAQVLATFVPPFPIYPPETAWMREPKTDRPGVILNSAPGRGRVVFIPADLDRRFSRDNLPDHGDLLANLVHWTANGRMPLQVQGAGLVDCHLYRQQGRMILHVVNLTSAGTWRQPVHELIPIGPLLLRVKLPPGVGVKRVRLLVQEKQIPASMADGWCRFELKTITDHEVAVIGL